eukprot:Mrub_08235.p1 GENE.Mrub_08235~~Mrub_08235.p1  ORF type:complete len:242 (-),score=58.24 Mrub_08235:125-817(-)
MKNYQSYVKVKINKELFNEDDNNLVNPENLSLYKGSNLEKNLSENKSINENQTKKSEKSMVTSFNDRKSNIPKHIPEANLKKYVREYHKTNLRYDNIKAPNLNDIDKTWYQFKYHSDNGIQRPRAASTRHGARPHQSEFTYELDTQQDLNDAERMHDQNHTRGWGIKTLTEQPNVPDYKFHPRLSIVKKKLKEKEHLSQKYYGKIQGICNDRQKEKEMYIHWIKYNRTYC